ncbi:MULTISPECIES: CATRA conflict system CASPASE/TPR repeat-associated protein [Streptacidiphilus]|uniref:CATRA conflict system CASPASE/TPR repeat-associated protein n=1 Tax=Streptacidiphilus cavernicola TaxID=3342716 RepID=A0ABV6UUP3_9ACTN|nr:CATRA conflict system CASPASE/TPR repeat-associated protein [Streptacidiphilus jeojiense]
MTAAGVHRPALVAHLFLRTDRVAEPGSEARALLERWWSAGDRLGMDDALPPWPDRLPATAAGDRPDQPRIVAARQQRVPGAHRIMLVIAYYDVTAVSVLLAPNDDAVGWRDLTESWQRLGPGTVPTGTAGLLGAAELLLGTVSDAIAAAPLTAATARSLGARLPVDLAPSAPGIAADAFRAGPGGRFPLWELTPPSAHPERRRLLVLAGTADEPALSRWAWQGNAAGAAPATLILLHSARLRDQCALLRQELPDLDGLTRRVEGACDASTDLLSSAPPGPVPVARLAAAEAALSELRTGRSGIIRSLALMASLDATLAACEQNVTAVGASAGALLDGDLRLARWAREQLAATRAGLTAAAERAAECAERLSTAVERADRTRRDQLSLLQTSIVGALLMALTAAQALQYTLQLPRPVRPALIAFLTLAALVLPMLILPRRTAIGLRAQSRVTDTALFTAAGAATAWLLSAVLWSALHGTPTPVQTLAAVGLGAALGGGLRWRLLRP